MPRVHLTLVGGGSIQWPLGEVSSIEPTADGLAGHFAQAKQSSADAWLFWDASLGAPDPEVVSELLRGSADVYHAGLCMGLRGSPRCVEYIEPLWMHACDAPPEIESTSWRVSFRACLVRQRVLAQLRGPCSELHSLEAAGLELGFHWLRRGVFVRHTPRLVREYVADRRAVLDVHDELMFAYRCFGRSWMLWAAVRGAATTAWSAAHATRVLASATNWSLPQRETFFRERRDVRIAGDERVGIVVPTIERYPYLRALLKQLAQQTVRPHEVIVVDQTPVQDRDDNLKHEFPELPLRWITLDRAGQCSSRNTALHASTSEFLLFVDDDDEVAPDLIQLHLEALQRFGSDVSCGIAFEDGVPDLPENFKFTRASDVFPTNNTMIRRSLLDRTGLFDPSYDRQPRADADLGMRAHMSGAFMVLNPEVRVLHHHAPRGGLRKHGARVVTYASSRTAVWQRHLPSPSEIYLARRYFGDGPAREVLWQRTLGTLSSHGGLFERVAKGVAGTLMLPNTVQAMQRIKATAATMLSVREEIPSLAPTPEEARP